ncbi:hypothetical protein BDW71DRAFT_212460 [Aspergillus fruticulosus]
MFLNYHSVTALALMVNSPQLFISAMYHLCNGILSGMLVSDECNDFAQRRKPLRASWPQGSSVQHTISAFPGVSQSIFLVIVRYLSVEDKTVPWEDQTCGYSLVGMFLAVISMNVAMVLLIGLSMGLLTSYMPLAAYVAPPSLPRVTPPPPPRDDDNEASLKPVMWGEIPQARRENDASDGSSDEPSRGEDTLIYADCTFTSKPVIPPSLARFYG